MKLPTAITWFRHPQHAAVLTIGLFTLAALMPARAADSAGGHDYKAKLSQQRAATVVAELVKNGIAAGRLTSSGVGPDKPIADNDSSDGRARSRRVELVKG